MPILLPPPQAETKEEKAALTPAGLSVEDEELVVVALLHDIGETLSPINHGEVAAGTRTLPQRAVRVRAQAARVYASHVHL